MGSLLFFFQILHSSSISFIKFLLYSIVVRLLSCSLLFIYFLSSHLSSSSSSSTSSSSYPPRVPTASPRYRKHTHTHTHTHTHKHKLKNTQNKNAAEQSATNFTE